MTIDGIEDVATQAGSSGGGADPQMGAGLDVPKDAIGQLTIELLPFNERRPGAEILAEIREKVEGIPGVIVETRKREGGPWAYIPTRGCVGCVEMVSAGIWFESTN